MIEKVVTSENYTEQEQQVQTLAGLMLPEHIVVKRPASGKLKIRFVEYRPRVSS